MALGHAFGRLNLTAVSRKRENVGEVDESRGGYMCG